MDGDAGLHGGIAIAADCNQAVKKIRFLLRQRQWIPTQLVRRGWRFSEWPAADQARGDFFIRLVRDRRANAVGPGAAIGCARRRKWRTAELLGVKAKGMVLRRILASGQRSRNRLRRELVAETRLIPNIICPKLICHCAPLTDSRLWPAAPPHA